MLTTAQYILLTQIISVLFKSEVQNTWLDNLVLQSNFQFQSGLEGVCWKRFHTGLQTYDSIPSERVSDLALAVPCVQHSFSVVVVHHGVVAIPVCELYLWVPLCSCLGVISKVDGSGICSIVIDEVDHSTGHKGVSYRPHPVCLKQTNRAQPRCLKIMP